MAAGTRIESHGTAVADNGCGVDNTVADNGVRRFKAVVRTPPWKTCHPTRHGRCGRVTCIESLGTAVAITAGGGAGRRGRAHLPLWERPMFLARV